MFTVGFVTLLTVSVQQISWSLNHTLKHTFKIADLQRKNGRAIFSSKLRRKFEFRNARFVISATTASPVVKTGVRSRQSAVSISSILKDEPIAPKADRPVFVCLPGLDAGECMSAQISRLESEFGDVHVYSYSNDDCIGWDHSFYNLYIFMKNIREADNRPIWLLGESFGACLAMTFIARSTDIDIDRLILVNPASAYNLNPILPLGTPLLQWFPDPLFDLARIILIPFIAEWNRIPSERRGLESAISQIPQKTTYSRLTMLMNFEYATERYLRAIRQPTLIIASEKDRLLPSVAESERLLELIPNSKAVVLEGSGHACLLERDVDLVEIMRNNGFLELDLGVSSESTTLHASAEAVQYVPLSDSPSPPPPPSLSEPPSPSPSSSSLSSSILDWTPPTPIEMQQLSDYYSAWKFVTSPLFIGLDNVPSNGPLLFVGNHTVYGLFDVPLMYLELYQAKGILLRSLAHESHWSVEFGLGKTLEKFGSVRATPRNFYRLLKEEQPVLLFPGGSREVCKRKGEKYKLFWKDETDFIRVAMRTGATVIPFSAIGAEDIYDIGWDTNDLKEIFKRVGVFDSVNAWLKERDVEGSDWFPVPSNWWPNAPRLYFKFGTPIALSGMEDRVRDREFCADIYRQVREEVEEGIEELVERRAQDPESELSGRLVRMAIVQGSQPLFNAWDSLQEFISNQ